jgi:hypothetical protein
MEKTLSSQGTSQLLLPLLPPQPLVLPQAVTLLLLLLVVVVVLVCQGVMLL